MKNLKPGDPVYAFKHGCGLGLAFRGIVLDVKKIPDEKGEFNARALVLDTSIPGQPRVAESTRLHRDNSTTRDEARQTLKQYGYADEGHGEKKPMPTTLAMSKLSFMLACVSALL